MTHIIAVHSFRRGTGKTVLAVNLAALLATSGKKVGLVDADLQLPSLHIPFGLHESEIDKHFNDFLWENCEIEEAVYDVTSHIGAKLPGKVFLIPASSHISDIARILQTKYSINMVYEGLMRLAEKKGLDYIILDTSAGLHEGSLTFIALAEVLVLVMRPDPEDFQGSAVTIDITTRLNIPNVLMVANFVSQNYDSQGLTQEIEGTFKHEVAAILPVSDEMMAFGSGGIFVMQYPRHPITTQLIALAQRVHDILSLC